MRISEFHNTIQRYRSLYSDKISSMPIAILMPHSSCNCRCRMCDIWKGNNKLRQLELKDMQPILTSLRLLKTRQVLFSGGEAILHSDFFKFCGMLQDEGIYISLLSTGITLKQHASEIVNRVNEIIVSLDGNETIHNFIRNIPAAYSRLKEGIIEIKSAQPQFPISARTVIHKLNFKIWDDIILSAHELRLDSISFLPADISSEAFNRQHGWEKSRQHEIAVSEEELPALEMIIKQLIKTHQKDFKTNFIAESEERVKDIYRYYKALNARGEFPYKKCNAPWVSAVIEPDGNVRPCFFHQVIGNIHEQPLEEVLNGRQGREFRKNLDISRNETCKRCVCSLNLRPTTIPGLS